MENILQLGDNLKAYNSQAPECWSRLLKGIRPKLSKTLLELWGPWLPYFGRQIQELWKTQGGPRLSGDRWGTLDTRLAASSLFCGHPEALGWRNLQFSVYLEMRGWRSFSGFLGRLTGSRADAGSLPHSHPCKHCFSKAEMPLVRRVPGLPACRQGVTSFPPIPLNLPSLLFPQSTRAPPPHLHLLVRRNIHGNRGAICLQMS